MRERETALARRGEDTVGTGLPHIVVQSSRGGGHFTTRENEASGGCWKSLREVRPASLCWIRLLMWERSQHTLCRLYALITTRHKGKTLAGSTRFC